MEKIIKGRKKITAENNVQKDKVLTEVELQELLNKNLEMIPTLDLTENGNYLTFPNKEEAQIYAVEYQKQNRDKIAFCDIIEGFSMYHGPHYRVVPVFNEELPSKSVKFISQDLLSAVFSKSLKDKELINQFKLTMIK